MEQTVTLVTCYYRISSKHSTKDYFYWISLLFQKLNTNLVLFTNTETYPLIKDILKKSDVNLHVIFKDMNEFTICKKYPESFWTNQFNHDKCAIRKSKIHNGDVYKIWNTKFDFLKEAIELNPFNSTKFIWNDIGSMRNNEFSTLLNIYPKYNNISNSQLDIIQMNHFLPNDYNKLFFNTGEIRFSGSIFGGTYETILKLHTLYYKMFDHYVKNNYFIGDDQMILASTYIQNSELFNCIIPKNRFIDPWFWLYYSYII